MIRTSAYLLRVRGEPIGVAYGTENWFRAQDFVQIPRATVGLPAWITETVWESLIVARRRLDSASADLADHHGWPEVRYRPIPAIGLNELCRGSTRPDDADRED